MWCQTLPDILFLIRILVVLNSLHIWPKGLGFWPKNLKGTLIPSNPSFNHLHCLRKQDRTSSPRSRGHVLVSMAVNARELWTWLVFRMISTQLGVNSPIIRTSTSLPLHLSFSVPHTLINFLYIWASTHVGLRASPSFTLILWEAINRPLTITYFVKSTLPTWLHGLQQEHWSQWGFISWFVVKNFDQIYQEEEHEGYNHRNTQVCSTCNQQT
jgi:hypothetical protein